jgi:hypothetical protein
VEAMGRFIYQTAPMPTHPSKAADLRERSH